MAEKACHVFGSATQVGLTQALGRMRDTVVKLIDHYARVNDGSSALLRTDLLSICASHGSTEAEFCLAFAQELAQRFSVGEIDTDRAAFAADDLHSASDYALTGFALRIFDALEYGEATPSQMRELIAQQAPGDAA